MISLKDIRDKNAPKHIKNIPPMSPKFDSKAGKVNIPTPIVILIHNITTYLSDPLSNGLNIF